MRLDDYAAFFRERVLRDGQIVLHNADLTPPRFDAPRAISWRATEKPLTEARRLVPRGLPYDLEQNLIWAMTELPVGGRLRDGVIGRILLEKPAVVWRNFEASMDTAAL